MQEQLSPTLERCDGYWRGRFRAMASPCEVLLETESESEAAALTRAAAREAWRIERKFSRYRTDNVIHAINNSNGGPVEVDAETARLLDFAERCHRLSDGLFDVTSGILRKAWTFDGSDRLPAEGEIRELLKHIGWEKTDWSPPRFTLPAGMQIDLGGIGKEYAVDRVAALLGSRQAGAVLVNFGGDLCASGPRRDRRPWLTGIENPEQPEAAAGALELWQGGLATSGDSRRYLYKDGRRYSHILNPKTGWPVEDAPRSVTVAAPTCTEAGMLASLASLRGRGAESFLDAQDVKYWCLR